MNETFNTVRLYDAVRESFRHAKLDPDPEQCCLVIDRLVKLGVSMNGGSPPPDVEQLVLDAPETASDVAPVATKSRETLRGGRAPRWDLSTVLKPGGEKGLRKAREQNQLYGVDARISRSLSCLASIEERTLSVEQCARIARKTMTSIQYVANRLVKWKRGEALDGGGWRLYFRDAVLEDLWNQGATNKADLAKETAMTEGIVNEWLARKRGPIRDTSK